LKVNTAYKLLGEFWDGKPECQYEVKFCSAEDILDYRYDRELLDIQDYSRKVNLSELLNVERQEQLSRIRTAVRDCDHVYIQNDILLHSENPIITRFLKKRIRQVKRGLSEKRDRK